MWVTILLLGCGGLALLSIFVWRRWVVPWRGIEELIADVRALRLPRTYLIEGTVEAKRAALALEDIYRRQVALTTSNEQHEFSVLTILGAMRDGLMAVDHAGAVRLTNPALGEFFANAQSSRSLVEIVRNAEIEQLASNALRTGVAETKTVTLLSTSRQVSVSALPTRNSDREVNGAVILFRDVTREKQLDDMRRDFVANVSHELRTPLSILGGYLETLRDEPDLSPDESKRILEVMDRHSRRLHFLVEDLLSLAQLEAAEPHLDFKDVDLAPFLEIVVGDWTKRLAAKQISISLEVEPLLKPVRADELRLQEMIYNLLDNAVKYSDVGGAIRIAATTAGNYAKVIVSDDGVGIPDADIARIFERFYRVDKSRSRDVGGTGLGLSIVKHIAQLHGGRVEVQSAPGKGTTMNLFVPVAKNVDAN